MSKIEKSHEFGALLRFWRAERRLSQADLAHDIETPPRHISFLETGRANPSRNMVARVASALDVPLRDRNALLKAAGYADVYSTHALSDAEMLQLRQAVTHMIKAQNPYPSFVIDSRWNVLDANDGGQDVMALVADEFPFEPSVTPVNMLDAVFSPDGFRSHISNWERYARHFIQRLHRQSASGQELDKILDRVRTHSGLPSDWWKFDVGYVDTPMLPIEMIINGHDMTFFTVVSAIALPTSALAQELMVETMFPANAETEALLFEAAASLDTARINRHCRLFPSEGIVSIE